ncbi:MAG: fructosamine kinase family protein [Planctomycetota bacterium]|nr:fructosamine kinase family protein [Planctomycetota bacterium]
MSVPGRDHSVRTSVNVPDAIREALRCLDITNPITDCDHLSGGCIHDVRRIQFTDRDSLVAKSSNRAEGIAQLRSEQDGLAALSRIAEQALVVPEVVGFHQTKSGAVLLMEYLTPGMAGHESWEVFGRSLACLHEVRVGERYGFQEDNFIGGTHQRNDWHDDWVDFNRNCRFQPQISLAQSRGHVSSSQGARLDQLLQSLSEFLPAGPRPSLLHGDLWSGNIMSLSDGRMAIIDPACSIGDGWADIAMMQLFGGVPTACIESYATARTDDSEVPSERLAVYQLYHLLNHVNLFGTSYLGRSMQMVEALLRA